MSLIGITVFELGSRNGNVHVESGGFNISQVASELADPAKAQDVHQSVQALFQFAGAPPLIALAFVVFFYCLGCLYDERKDRSVLFWKSLPLSDTETGLSKFVSAAIVAPAIAFSVAVLTGLAVFALTSVVVMMHGGNPLPLWDITAILSGAANLLFSIPMYALWALPTIGWLMLCSAWSGRVPFLWAVLAPVFLGATIGIIGLMSFFNLTNGWYWSNIVGRLLGGTIPGMELIYRYGAAGTPLRINGPEDVAHIFSLGNSYAGLANPQVWIGVAVGAAMIFAAIRLRKYRDEG